MPRGTDQQTNLLHLVGATCLQKRTPVPRKELIATALNSLKLHVVRAAETLTGLLSSESQSVRQRAAETILSFTTKSLESEELLQRISDLERKVATYERPA
jgi:hypothetical protein